MQIINNLKSKAEAKKDAKDIKAIEKILNNAIDDDVDQKIGNKKPQPRYKDFINEEYGTNSLSTVIWHYTSQKDIYTNPDNLFIRLLNAQLKGANRNTEVVLRLVEYAYRTTRLSDAKMAKIMLDQGVDNIIKTFNQRPGSDKSFLSWLGLSDKLIETTMKNDHERAHMLIDQIVAEKYPDDLVRFSDRSETYADVVRNSLEINADDFYVAPGTTKRVYSTGCPEYGSKGHSITKKVSPTGETQIRDEIIEINPMIKA